MAVLSQQAGNARSKTLRPPWPDVVISTGWRTVPITRWIAEQSGGRTRTVQMGRKGGDVVERFDAAVASLEAVAHASGGRYVTASSAAELQDALVQTVATSYSVFKGSVEVANASLASSKPLYLPEGDYRVVLDGSSPKEVPVSLRPRDSVKLTLEKQDGFVSHFEQRDSIEYRSCEDIAASIERLEARQESPEPYQSATN